IHAFVFFVASPFAYARYAQGLRLKSKCLYLPSNGQVIFLRALRGDDTCVFLACDFDGETWSEDVVIYQSVAESMGVDVGIERSRSGKGAHAWIFFSDPVPARAIRMLGTIILTKSTELRHSISLRSYDRFFPNQDYMPKGGFGNLIALPLQKQPREEGNTVFLDNKLLPHEDQWTYLSEIRCLSSLDLDCLNRKYFPGLSRVKDERDFSLRSDERIIESESEKIKPVRFDSPIEISISSHLSIPLLELPSRLVMTLKRAATFPNPKFYELQRMRMSTYPHPRFIFSGEARPDSLIMPRGTLDKLVSILEKAGAEVVIKDERPRRRKISAEFAGKLTDLQKEALDEVKKHDYGILVSPPGSGKTVIGCALIAERKVSTLVIVHRQPLVEQWRDRMNEFIGIDRKDIGTISGTKSKLTGKIDIAMIQSLVKNDALEEIAGKYTQIIVDECHHIPAASFESVGENPPYHILAEYLTGSLERNEIIAKDIILELNSGHYPLVLTDRKTHIDQLVEKINGLLKAENYRHAKLFRLDGAMSLKERKLVISQIIECRSSGIPCCIIATASLIGEGFDLPFLDVLVLSMPMSFKGRLIQYVGRLQRVDEKKDYIRVYDYLDSFCATTLKMYRKRVKTYKSMEFILNEPNGNPLFDTPSPQP
ncbi:MAG: DEAD/DEAH box helicase family protein, partial [Victivallales bacterium]